MVAVVGLFGVGLPAAADGLTSSSVASVSDYSLLTELDGKTYVAVSAFSDNGPTTFDLDSNAFLELTFLGSTAVAVTQCGTLSYDDVQILTEGRTDGFYEIDFGSPSGPGCELAIGLGVPSGHMLWSQGGDGRAGVGNGFTAINLREGAPRSGSSTARWTDVLSDWGVPVLMVGVVLVAVVSGRLKRRRQRVDGAA